MNQFGPVSSFLVKILNEQMSSGIRVHVWLDPESYYLGFVNALKSDGRHNYQLIVFCGSYLEVMLQIDQLLSGIEPPLTLIYLPGHDRKMAETTPILEMIEAGKIYQQSFAELVKQAAVGQCTPEAIEQFLAHGALSLADADVWLSEQLREQDGQFWSTLHGFSSMGQLVEAILYPQQSFQISRRLQDLSNADTFWRYLEIKTGIPKDWPPRVNFAENTALTQEIGKYELLYVLASWALCVEFVCDLGALCLVPQLATIPELDKNLRCNCRQLATYLREHEPTFYQNIADETENEEFFADMRNTPAEHLGRIDSFRFEEETLFNTAMEKALHEDFAPPYKWAGTRLEGNCFWLQISDQRRWSWELLKGACELGIALQKAPSKLGVMNSVEEAAEFYAANCALVDQHHRHLEQLAYRLLKSSLPEFESLKLLMDYLRELHQKWIDTLAVDFNNLCRQYSFLPADDYQQRTIFSQILKPLTRKGKVAYFMVDALRYEMAVELKNSMNFSNDDEVKLNPRLAELPTNTNIGMNLLAPCVKDGLVELVVKDDQIHCVQGTGDYEIYNPQSRRAAIKDVIGGQSSPEITVTEILEMEPRTLKRKFSHSKVAVIPYQEIDKAGENGTGPQKFSECLRILRKAWQNLREAGFTHFLFVADHGFLLVDPRPERNKRLRHGRAIDNNRRHIISEIGVDHDKEVRVRLRDLNYKVDKDLHLMMPEDACLFEDRFCSRSFAHGGNSLQERVIPVLQIIHSKKHKKHAKKYKISVSKIDFTNVHTQALSLHIIRDEDLPLLANLATEAIEIEISPVTENIQLQIQHAFGGGQYNNETLTINENSELHVVFCLEGTSTGSTQLCISLPHVEGEPFITEEFFPVVGKTNTLLSGTQVQSPEEESSPQQSSSWLDNIDDKNTRCILQYLEDHGSISEQEATSLLEGARAFRKFRRKLEHYANKCPFTIQIESVDGVNRLVRKGGRN